MDKKKGAALLLALVFLISLCACGSSEAISASGSSVSDGEKPDSTVSAQTEVQEPAAEEETSGDTDLPDASSDIEGAALVEEEPPELSFELPITDDPNASLSCWYSFPGFFTTYKNWATDSCFVTEYEARTGVHIDWTIVDTETSSEAFALMIAGGDYCDMIYNFSNLYSNGIDHAIANDIVVDIGPMLQSEMPFYASYIYADEDLLRAVTSPSGAIGYVSGILDKPAYVYGPCIRKDWLNDCGLDEPVTYDDYYNVLKAFQSQEGATGALWIPYTGTPEQHYLAAGYGIPAFSNAKGMRATLPFYVEEGSVSYGPTQDAYLEYLTMLNKWYSEGLIYSDFVSSGNSLMSFDTNLVNNGIVGLWFANTEFVRSFTPESANDPDFEIVGILDARKEADQVLHIGADTSRLNGASMSFTTACEDLELALHWLDYSFTEEGSILNDWGVEGISYDVDADGNKSISSNITNPPDGTPAIVMEAVLTAGQWPGLQTMEREQAGYTDQERAMVKVWEESSDSSANYPKNVDLTSDEASQFSAIYSDAETYLMENTCRFIMGERPLSEFEDFVAQLESIGIGECVEIKQVAYDRYMSY